jgi:hypothetical protein
MRLIFVLEFPTSIERSGNRPIPKRTMRNSGAVVLSRKTQAKSLPQARFTIVKAGIAQLVEQLICNSRKTFCVRFHNLAQHR